MQVEVAVATPVFRVPVLVVTDPFGVSDGNAANPTLDTLGNDVLDERSGKVRAALTPRVMQACCPLSARVVARGDFLREVVAVLFEAVAEVKIGVLGAVGDSGNVTDTETDPSGFGAGRVGRLDLVVADEVEILPVLHRVIDGPDLLQVLDRNAGARLVFD